MSKTSQLQEPLPPILKRNGFQLCDGDFTVDNIVRVHGARLQELFQPSSLRLETDQEVASAEARRLFTKPFFAAQLRYYGIPFEASSTKEDLELLLQDAVQQGKCDRVPQSVVELQVSMQVDYLSLLKQREAECAAWRAEKKRIDDEAFEKCKTPSQRAAFDPQRFMDMYFLTNGLPDKTKTTEVLTLSGLKGGSAGKLRRIARNFSDLHFQNVDYLSDGEFCIGWDRKKVTELALDQWDRDSQEVELLIERQKRSKHVTQASSEETSNGANNGSETFNKDISGGDKKMDRAAVDVGIIEGTRLLSLSEGKSAALDEDSEASDEDEEEVDTVPPVSSGGMKRRRDEDSEGSDEDEEESEEYESDEEEANDFLSVGWNKKRRRLDGDSEASDEDEEESEEYKGDEEEADMNRKRRQLDGDFEARNEDEEESEEDEEETEEDEEDEGEDKEADLAMMDVSELPRPETWSFTLAVRPRAVGR
ncbi:hypothetical protein V8C35DRAFT_332684 [Trichoderma chlorosporum]